jgi:hypothetical protein
MVFVGRFSSVVFSVVTLAAACCAVLAGTALPAGASPESAGTWGPVQDVPGLAALNAGGNASVTGVSCGSPGNCAAVGGYTDSSGHGQAFVVNETDGTWGMAQEVPGSAALNAGGSAGLSYVSCTSAGNCAAGGDYVDSSGHQQAFVVDESGGSWGTAEEVPGLAALNVGGNAYVTSLACASPGNCAAGGDYLWKPAEPPQNSSGPLPFVVAEVNGSWGTAEEVPGVAAGADGDVGLVWCAPAGYCAAAGGSGDEAFVLDESGGSWRTAGEITISDVRSLSCASPGNCAAVGDDGGEASVANEVNGSWGRSELVDVAAVNPDGNSYMDSVSCPSPGNCTAVGHAWTGSGADFGKVFMVSESGGVWGTAHVLPGAPNPPAGGPIDAWVSCASTGNCAVAALYETTSYVVDETGGSWDTAQEIPAAIGTADIGAGSGPLSCASAGSCTAAGSANGQAFLVDETPKPLTSTVLSLKAARVTYGNEQAERVSVAVSAPSGGTPSGTVTVKAGTAVLCGNLTLAVDQANCTVSATRLPAGTWHLTASYSGSADLAPSASAAQILTVAKAASKVTLALSAARVTYGHEGSERLTVKVTGQYAGTPAGKVTVKSGKVTVCTITLASGKGSCTMAARKLPAGTRTLTAVYAGSGDFTGAASARKTLKVVK